MDTTDHISSGPAQPLLFLPAWQPDDAEQAQRAQNQTRIRRHVMKNVVRAKRKTSIDQHHRSLITSQQAQLPLLTFGEAPIQWRFYMPAFVNNWMTCFLPRMASRTEGALISHQGLWLEVAMKSEALFHATMALSAAYHHKLSHEKLQLLALYHIGKAIAQINLALSNDISAVGDDIVLAVVAIAAYENLKGDSTSSRKHMNGLQSMVSLRGGLGSLGQLARHALNWVDCSFATVTLGKPFFIKQGPWMKVPDSIPESPLKYVDISISAQFLGVLSQLRELTQILNCSYSRLVTPDEMWTFSDLRTHVEQELLLMRLSAEHISRDNKDLCSGTIPKILTLGAMIYVNLVLRCILPLSSVHRTLSAQIAQSLSAVNDAIPDLQCEILEILLWSAMLGGTVSTDPVIWERQKSVVLQICGHLNLSTWTQCRHIMESVVYSHRGCGDLCEDFYKQATI